jgi:predicted P-loop ATPase
MSLSKLGEAKRLNALGLAVHWLRPQSKVPVKAGWSGDSRETFKELKASYKTGYNIGTKLGKPSEIEDCFLAVLDIDIKGTHKKYSKEAEAWVEEHFPGLLASAPITHSGRGNGSKHVWCLVQSPMDSRKLTASGETIEVMMPSTQPSKSDIEKLGKKKTSQGWRLRPAWEVDFMCAGRQVVLPPSIHPDSGKAYRWGRTLESVDDLSIITRSTIEDIASAKKSTNGRPKGSATQKFTIEDVPEMELEMKLSPTMVSGIYDGDSVEDRSAFCLTVALTMVKARFTDPQILGVLTNKDYFIGSVAFEHSKTSNRQRAARWAYDYCLRKARNEADAAHVFDCEVKVYDTLPPEKKAKQLKRIVSDLGKVDWKKKLDRTDNDKLKPTFKNVKLIIQHVVDEKTFIYDEFSRRQTYGVSTPWGGVKGESIEDVDEIRIKDWFAHEWKIEPNTNLVGEVISQICSINSFHPVKDYLETLEWDDEPRLSSWLQTYLGAEGDESYLSAVGKKFLVAAVARVYEPGKKFDHMPIFEGLQGIGKSTVGRILASEKWFYDSELNLHDKDSALNLQGQWIVEMGELANINRADVRTIKSFITRQVDKVRPPYGKRMVESPRQCVFFGTTNDDSYLKDKTGNRRFWPVCIPKGAEIDLDGLMNDRDQLWAEALSAYECGELLYLDKDIEAVAKEVQNSRVIEDVTDVMFDRLRGWKIAMVKARKLWKKQNPRKKLPHLKFKLTDLFEEFGEAEYGETIQPPLREYKSDNNAHLQWAASALRQLGFEKYPCGGRPFWRLTKSKK